MPPQGANGSPRRAIVAAPKTMALVVDGGVRRPFVRFGAFRVAAERCLYKIDEMIEDRLRESSWLWD
eukprot:4196996-Pleurochrysis_carterae.AAC.1